MKPLHDTEVSLQPGTFIRPAGALLRTAPDQVSLLEVWREVGPCLSYPKPDGWRIQVHKVGGIVKLFSRTGKDWAAQYPGVVRAVRTQITDERAILDTELVGFNGHGHHQTPAKLRRAAQYRLFVLDAMYLDEMDLTSRPTEERVSFIQDHLRSAFQGMLVCAEYTHITSLDEWLAFYQTCRARRMDGFDGAIIKRLDAPYFVDVLKVKPEDTVDAVVVGAYLDRDRTVRSLLLAVPEHQRKRWVPIARVARGRVESAVWAACQAHIRDRRPDDIEEPPDTPDVWFAPETVVEVTIQEPQASTGYILRLEYPRKCTLREDKGPNDATPFEQILRTVPSVANALQQLSLLEE